ncbi:NTF2-like N-terminal transpeptidase domain-containing protein [Dysgonomonas sp. 520]|uniref:NTF2-like N-terminal transpeptidase domain-containing protein n=1 Tax=Dysgonomonas sp. 520 TaxID=2302931 RepID=UPI0013D40221|nr:NTF2-like N-terminal transpeptidase domain-containing protein [Dysgonomonas sp. 520]NDW08355.1 DUF4878 domain-containing protein [Dysgonomonas sp. 520]
MKKLLYLSLLTVFCFSFTSCSDSPESVTKKYIKDMCEVQMASERLFDYVAKPDDMSNDEFKEAKKKFVEGCTIKDIEILKNEEGKNVEYEDNESKAKVRFKITFKNGKVEEESLKLVKQNGSWKVDDYSSRFLLR